jgi:DNA-binding PadR family transcriptional regulator
MQIKLSKDEVKALKSLDPKTKGDRPWQTARQVAGGVFRKKEENLDQDQIRVVRNAFRKIVRENLVEISTKDRGNYRITDKGRKLLISGETELTGVFERGLATRRGKEAAAVKKVAPKKATKVKAAPKKAAKKAPKKAAKKAEVAKVAAAPKKASTKKKSPSKKAAIKVEDKTATATAKPETKNGNGKGDAVRKGPPQFKRRKLATTTTPSN